MTEAIGYVRLIERYRLRALMPRIASQINSAVHGRRVRNDERQVVQEFQPSYRPEDSLAGDLQFAFRYEGLNLIVLDSLFESVGDARILSIINAQPQSAFSRRLGYLYEWLTGRPLQLAELTISPKASYIPALDEQLQFGFNPKKSPRNTKYRVVENLPGNRDFCPIVSRTLYLESMLNKNLKQRTQETLAKYDTALLQRAASFLYLKETQSSFDIEHERPSPDRARRFADLLRAAEAGAPLSEDRFLELQNAVVDARFREASFRTQQNWIGDSGYGYRPRVSLVPPRPVDVPTLMQGLIDFSEVLRKNPDLMDPVIAATSISFGFVFIHPFMDGNGRLHRYLIHEQLSAAGFTPKGIVLPVSAVILANLEQYNDALISFSRPVNALTTYDPELPQQQARGNDARYFKFFDATEQASFLFSAIGRTVEHDLDEEISFLLGFDRAKKLLNEMLDWPGQTLDTFIQVVHQNGGRLSINKRKAHFDWMSDDEVRRAEQMVAESFQPDGPVSPSP